MTNGQVRLEGAILDDEYLDGLRCRLGRQDRQLARLAVGTNDVERPAIEWGGDHTEIQMTGVTRDLGTQHDPDTYYQPPAPTSGASRHSSTNASSATS